MKKDLDVIVHSFSEPEIHIYPISDVHLGSPDHNKKAFMQFVDKILSDPIGYCVLVGDLCDTALKNSKSDVYTSTMTIMEQLQTAADLLKPLADAGRILGAVGGNHEARISREVGLDASYIIMERLGIKDLYRPALAFIHITVDNQNPSHDNRRTYILAITHGSGGGSSYAFLNKNQHFAQMIDGCDVLITGHTHKPAAIAPARLRVDRRRKTVKVSPILCVTASSWMDYGGYALGMMLLPSATCRPQVITLGQSATLTM